MKPRTTARSARCGVAIVCSIAVVCGLALLAAGCGASASSSGSAPASAASSSVPANSALCADAAALRALLDKLRRVNVGAGMVDEITADLHEVQTALTTLVNDARGQWQAQTSALSSALAKLRTSVSTLAAHPGVGAVSDLVTALGGVNTAAQNLLAAVNTSCPSASPS
jgi:predicted RNA-binding Zn ribbon-like protein